MLQLNLYLYNLWLFLPSSSLFLTMNHTREITRSKNPAGPDWTSLSSLITWLVRKVRDRELCGFPPNADTVRSMTATHMLDKSKNSCFARYHFYYKMLNVYPVYTSSDYRIHNDRVGRCLTYYVIKNNWNFTTHLNNITFIW